MKHIGFLSPAFMLSIGEQDEELEAVSVRDRSNTGTPRLTQREHEALEKVEFWLTTGQRWQGTSEGPVFNRQKGRK